MLLKSESNLLASASRPLQAKMKFRSLNLNQMIVTNKNNQFVTRRKILLATKMRHQILSTIPLSTPLYTDSTVPPTTFGEPSISVNASDAGAKTSGFQSSHVSPSISPIYQDDPEMIYRDDEDELPGFTFSPFTVHNESDDEAPVTKGQLKSINEKLDTLLQASKLSSSDEYSQASIKFILETLTKEHSTNLEKINNVVNASTSICNETTEKVDKLSYDATTFMNNFQYSFETNIARANEEIANLGSSLKERTKLQEVGTGIITDHEEFKSSISSQISKLHDYIAMESKGLPCH
ncbi:unnamed protein product [Lactuca saligna]|uniref:Uncharacterized protein n=1 Tax=Lactuca saligna TaxID=75948 RepID=A0AA36E127_LACSI|nr:unnamed protein product [Lactuca saligna]